MSISGLNGGKNEMPNNASLRTQDMSTDRRRASDFTLTRAHPKRETSMVEAARALTNRMKPTAPLRNKFSAFATAPCRGLSLSR